VALYRGPFLDGFFVRDAGEFERWVEAQRTKYGRRVLDALATLAAEAAAMGDAGTAVGWWRRAAELDSLDATLAFELVRALARAGDRPGALRHARRHAEALEAELGLPPDTRLVDLVEALKRA
jgi:DNA-binding SARP family transcriptional activator